MSNAQTAFLFPGQGAQYPGMGKDLYEHFPTVRQTYEQANDIVGYDLARLSFADPDGQIDLTRYTQPVLLTHSVACLRIFMEQSGNAVSPGIAAGHSLGEYTALVSAGALTFEHALHLVKVRGELMGEYGEGEMEALMLPREAAVTLAERHYCALSAANLPEQNVVGGRPEDLDALIAAMAEQYPKKRSVRLKTEGAFHTYYMVAAAQHFRAVLKDTEIQTPQIDVLSNFTGGIHDRDADAIRSRLFLQLFNPVLWHQNLLAAHATGATCYIEFGGGLGKGEHAADKRPNLEGIVKRTFRADPALQYLGVINQKTLDEAVQATHG